MTGPLHWLARLAVLTLSLLATLSILGAIASIGTADMAGRPAGDRGTVLDPSDARQVQRPATAPAERAAAERARPAGEGGRSEAVVFAPPPPPDPLRWLEPLTYAVLALAVLAAMAVLLLWRIALQLERRG
ncbi:MAG TPA: hypothetical protein VEZ48_04145 [Sphingomonadaceae bacterium]|nr:hypothetical protein [Sphingomonadaceae bacterium]